MPTVHPRAVLAAVILVLTLVAGACAPQGGSDAAEEAPAGDRVDGEVAPGGTTDEATPDGATPDGTPAPPRVPPLHPAIDHLAETVVTVTSAAGERYEVLAKVAAADADRRQGLMQVSELPEGFGMLFLFEQERAGGFWMYRTLIPLDILFADAQGAVHTAATMVPCPSDRSAECPVTTPDAPYLAALEVPAGWAGERGVGPGASLQWTSPVAVAER